jgi:cytochrome c-type biogenesis protein CcmH
VMSAFVLFCIAMAIAAIATLTYPLLRPLAGEDKGHAAPSKATVPAIALAVMLPLAAALLYGQVSTFPWDNPQAAAPLPPGHGSGAAGTMDQVAIALEARLAEQPDDAQGWRMLGRTYLVNGNAAKAVTAYEKSAALLPQKDPGLELDLAEALVLTYDEAQRPRAKAITDAALAADGSNQKALWYAGVIAVQAGDNESAKAHWLKLVEQNPPDEIRQVLVAQLAELGVTAPAGPAGAVAVAATPATSGSPPGSLGLERAPQGRTLRVSVKIDPAVADKLKPGVPLFVSAREPGIPGPPLAAVRITTDQLPASVVLSDANSMIEGRNLSSVNDVEVVARVAFGGTPMVSSGDLIGSSVQKKGGSEDLDVVIARVQP